MRLRSDGMTTRLTDGSQDRIREVDSHSILVVEWACDRISCFLACAQATRSYRSAARPSCRIHPYDSVCKHASAQETIPLSYL